MLVKNVLVLGLVASLLSGCVSTSRYSQKHDTTPSRLPTNSELEDAIPTFEPPSRGGNRDYTVRGKHYKVMKSSKDFSEVGIASYYGEKFHGHLTSNGEIYNMYAMSAAHKHLPLPSYVKVTNLDNNKTVVVRVNDRGPFHPGRVIDLSFSAAYKLDMLKNGTANVRVDIIERSQTAQVKASEEKLPSLNPQSNEVTATVSEPVTDAYIIQIFATKNPTMADSLVNALTSLYQKPVQTDEINGIFRVQLGPIATQDEADELLAMIKSSGYPEAFSKKVTM
ncbi:septal ring lytic transglycosylase RlpA family protein [Thalassotalea sp. LPB0316]|uniref:septal ring lytic transglycosylase RlpA family protein n=1 Tax=Thalassotalea sp. LPB0316 TaxID=2769490 RepID=UPI00186917A0|nr:septal ring lytic transglycosylase RlpA family protein [Thalassotalea sp. LPB0316]QOL24457.1 septal ring lytic transglycosylase RlpA family protein [Thalassotalea sp. LPB0316]